MLFFPLSTQAEMNKEYSFYGAHTAGWRLLLRPPHSPLSFERTQKLSNQNFHAERQRLVNRMCNHPQLFFFLFLFFFMSKLNFPLLFGPFFTKAHSLPVLWEFFWPCLWFTRVCLVDFLSMWHLFQTVLKAILPAFPLVHLGLGNFPFLCRNSVQTCR